ncbi:MAG: Mrp/NBP35 family ATP-binding protein [Spirochaetes bacterium]|nr:Mrp/NBP35 family ATP-binding protein [Spirochaetota bacterium]
MSEKNNMKASSDAEAQNKEAEENEALRSNMAKIENKLIVLSGKGGVGKSTVAVNLAVSLAEKKYKTGLLDIDIHGPSVPKLLGIENRTLQGNEERIMPVSYSEYLKVMSIGFMLNNSDDAVIWRGPLKYSIIKQFLKDVEWGNLDYLVVDSPPGTGDEPLSICQLIENPRSAIIVTTPQDVALSDVRKSVTFCRKLNLPILGVVENMSGFVCPHCGKTTDIFKTGGGSRMANDMGLTFLGSIPLEAQITENGDSGKPFAGKSSGSISQQNFSQIVEKIIAAKKK